MEGEGEGKEGKAKPDNTAAAERTEYAELMSPSDQRALNLWLFASDDAVNDENPEEAGGEKAIADDHAVARKSEETSDKKEASAKAADDKCSDEASDGRAAAVKAVDEMRLEESTEPMEEETIDKRPAAVVAEDELAETPIPTPTIRRVTKPTQFYEPAKETKTREERAITEGKGEKLKDIPNVVRNFRDVASSDPRLKMLHSVVFGRGKKTGFKARLLRFSGVVHQESEEEEERKKMKERICKLSVQELKAVMDLVDIERSRESFGIGKKGAIGKELLCQRFLEWLEKPKAGKTSVPASKKSLGTKRKATASPAPERLMPAQHAVTRRSRKAKCSPELSAALLAANGDPRSLARLFWQNIGNARRDDAEEVARRVIPPLVTTISSEEEGGETGWDPGTCRSIVDADTQVTAIGAWNSKKEVPLVRVNAEEWCLARVTPNQKGAADFQACAMSLHGLDGCTKSTHKALQGATVRMDVDDPVGLYAIACPLSKPTVKKKRCFSRPCLGISLFPPSLRELNQHEILLSFSFRPAVWKFLLEEYPGEQEMLRLHLGGEGHDDVIPAQHAPNKWVRKDTCSQEGCTNSAIQVGLCKSHLEELALHEPTTRQARMLSQRAPSKEPRGCSHEGCTNRVIQGGLCKRHGARTAPPKKCSFEGCTNIVLNSGLCLRHGAKARICKHEGCTNLSKRGGVCVRHGASGIKCSRVGCTNISFVAGVCWSHSDDTVKKRKECNVEGCTNYALKKGVCTRHGAEKRKCSYEGCSNNAQKGGLCIGHGGKVNRKVCSLEGCTTFARQGGLCIRHRSSLGKEYVINQADLPMMNHQEHLPSQEPVALGHRQLAACLLPGHVEQLIENPIPDPPDDNNSEDPP
mmetsp:Transcript_33169/g.80230  ORF Transcript_33169/g.80230 Transcript_33169/m.80230 type:complete len:867 (+) Transcript_33169:60-2660(+)